MKREEFKKFVQKNPQFVKYVQNKKMTWQQFFEIYDLYGENNSIWDSFKDTPNSNTKKTLATGGLVATVKELFELFKGVDLSTIQKTLSSLDKAIEAFKGFNNNDSSQNTYEERPRYKYFED